MERNIYEIELEIPNSGIFIMGLENENLIISLDLAKFECKKKLNAGELAKPLHPYIIYEVLEKNNKNNFNGVKIIDKRENENNIIYYFNFRLILKENEDNKNKEALKTLSFMQNFIPAYFFSYQIIGDSKAIPKNVLEYLKNRYGYEGKNYKSIFKKEVYINCNCFERLNFSHCEFESKVSLRFLKDNKYKEFHNGVDFSNCIFKNEVDFSYLHQAHHCLIINTIIMRKIHYLKIVFLRIRLISIILKLPIIFILTMLTLKIMLIFTSVNLKKQLVFMG